MLAINTGTGTVLTRGRGRGEGHFDVASGSLKNHTSALWGIAYRIVKLSCGANFCIFADMLVNAKRKF